PTPTPTLFPSVTGTATPSPAGSPDNDLIVKGKRIFEVTAGGVGCASCHGMDGSGSEGGAPYIRGASENQFRAALAGGAPAMSFIKLNEDEIAAVLAYLKIME
ncbi:MAG: cytochrome c, partial [Cyanobacteria bacterium NC_groundwater_1444_Ag_S-0.65um_54_12]|nr:cytochrome c [Cyanobacteria bacterium NC_groundwater_1444_Ag_S-0.65um_54_12]